MPRIKKYNEQEVIQKAMHVFWKNGYQATSMQVLEKEMGINKFSIYASFGNKDGLFLESLKCYKQQLQKLILKLENAENGIDSIKEYFYDFIEFSKDHNGCRGCLITNTANELEAQANQDIANSLSQFTTYIKNSFLYKLEEDKRFEQKNIEEIADYLLVAMFGLSTATKVFNPVQIEHYIKNIFTPF